MTKIVTRQSKVKNVAERYKESFILTEYWRKGWEHDPSHTPASDIYNRLKELGPTPNPDDVDAIIPIKYYSLSTCNECGKDVTAAAVIDVNCGEFEVTICASCCRALTNAIYAADHPEIYGVKPETS